MLEEVLYLTALGIGGAIGWWLRIALERRYETELVDVLADRDRWKAEAEREFRTRTKIEHRLRSDLHTVTNQRDEVLRALRNLQARQEQGWRGGGELL